LHHSFQPRCGGVFYVPEKVFAGMLVLLYPEDLQMRFPELNYVSCK